MYQKPSAALGGRLLVKAKVLVKWTPLTVRLSRFQELILLPRLLERQQSVPAPSKVKGAVIVAVSGLQVVPPPGVGVRVGPIGVEVRVGVRVRPVAVGVRVGVRVAVLVGPIAVDV